MSLLSALFGVSAVDVLREENAWLRKQNEELRCEVVRLADRNASADIETRKWAVEEGRHRMELERQGKVPIGPPGTPAPDPRYQGPGYWLNHLEGGGHLDDGPSREEIEEEERRFQRDMAAREAQVEQMRKAEAAGQ